ncbi:hypothetical protein [Siphonobacter curvatus]|uniref:Uncharacterized protein n=1 Tax=Siphonobacter curvatus TaxID=2094562 RepID=A0A2S7IQ37_9BACT|nr:hypothetical protein [Siphonobacter curvatus]PQA59825.1 hypothetical protein C5O19_09445 [Siphonobacter curvatus]
MREAKKLYYYIGEGHPVPEPGRYLVNKGKKGPGTVYLITAIVRTKQKRPVEGYTCYTLTLQRLDGLKELVVYEMQAGTCSVWVKGEEAFPCFAFDPNERRPLSKPRS